MFFFAPWRYEIAPTKYSVIDGKFSRSHLLPPESWKIEDTIRFGDTHTKCILIRVPKLAHQVVELILIWKRNYPCGEIATEHKSVISIGYQSIKAPNTITHGWFTSNRKQKRERTLTINGFFLSPWWSIGIPLPNWTKPGRQWLGYPTPSQVCMCEWFEYRYNRNHQWFQAGNL